MELGRLAPTLTNHRAPLDPAEFERLRDRIETSAGQTTWVLIGKDGGVKHLQHGELDIERLSAVIDAMPMRQRETREDKP